MFKYFKNLLKGIVVLFGVIVITSLSIDAADTLGGSQSTLLASLIQFDKSGCAKDASRLVMPDGTALCIDKYEASVSDKCPLSQVRSSSDSSTNVAAPDCVPVSKSGTLPWSFVTYPQAEQLCAKAGKELVSVDVWYKAALGTVAESCNIDGKIKGAGEEENCRSGIGIYDAVGNVWELAQGSVKGGMYKDRKIPPSGYITTVDEAGFPTETGSEKSDLYQADYLWSRDDGDFVIMRGGYYGGKSDAGIYSMHTNITTNFSGEAVGFRCMKRL